MHDQSSDAGDISHASVAKAIYGLVTVLAVLVAMEQHPPPPLAAAATLFGTTFALALAEAYAETLAGMLAQQRHLSLTELRGVWRAAAPVLVGAQAPTVVLLLATLSPFRVEQAIVVAQVVALLLLFEYGLQVGRMLHETWPRALLSGLLLASIGALIVSLKAVFH